MSLLRLPKSADRSEGDIFIIEIVYVVGGYLLFFGLNIFQRIKIIQIAPIARPP